MRVVHLLTWFASLIASLGAAAESGIYPVNLRTEYRTEPAGLDEPAPRLSWELRSSTPERRGQHQSAFQVLVASSAEKLEKDEGDLWDTGKRQSHETNQIVYDGKALAPRQQIWWKVRSWDERGEPSSWSQPALWTMGLMDQSNWQAQWIGYDAPAELGGGDRAAMSLEGAKWVWHEATPPVQAKRERRFFRKRLDIAPERRITRAIPTSGG